MCKCFSCMWLFALKTIFKRKLFYFQLNNVTVKVVQLEEQLQEERKRYFALDYELEQAHEESAVLKNQISSLETEVEKRDARLQQAYLDLDRKTEQLNSLNHKINKKEKTKVSTFWLLNFLQSII